MQIKRTGIFLFLTLLLCASLQAQNPNSNSPYSRLGLGDMTQQYLAASAGMGGFSAAFQDPFHLNMLNPAANASLKATAFEIGMFSQFTNLRSPDGNSAGVWTGNLSYLALGFPLVNPINESMSLKPRKFHWGMTFGLRPFSYVGYDIETSGSLPEIGNTRNLFQGSGGTNKLNWGNSVEYKNLSLGLDLAYFFGQMSYDREVQFPGLGIAYFNDFSDEIRVRGYLWTLGAQYKVPLGTRNEETGKRRFNKQFIVGAYGSSQTAFQTESRKLYRGFNPVYNDADTVLFVDGIQETGQMPAQVTIGLMYEERNRLRIGLDYHYMQWVQYENPAKPEQLRNGWRLSGGVEYIPNALSYNNYLQRIRYRAGAFHESDPRGFNTNLTRTALTLGLGFPVILPRQQTSFINTSFEFGRFGNVEALTEWYARMVVGFTLNDNSWFFKRKFN
jgi:hypothetical protein